MKIVKLFRLWGVRRFAVSRDVEQKRKLYSLFPHITVFLVSGVEIASVVIYLLMEPDFRQEIDDEF
ncbi:hypothetical protein AAGR22_10505 [Erwinia sp. HDF1-3R]|uniref:hypothetical protein n=1 Tax=Erwinia sp. HDF1-3R TaxID=3141543 RepID=UPI0031F573D6